MEQNQQLSRSQQARRYVDLLKARNKRVSLMAISACVVLILIAGMMLGFYFLLEEKPDDGKILPNVYVAGVNLGGMTQEEATNALSLAMGDSLATQNMVVNLPDDRLVLSPLDTQAFVSVDELVDVAYQYGRNGTKLQNRMTRVKAETQKYVIPLLDYMYLDIHFIRQAVDNFCANYSSTMIQSTYVLKGNRPDYRTVIADGISLSAVKHQTLQINIGYPQFALEPDVLYEQILDAYSMFQLTFTYEAPTALEPDPLDAQAIFDQLCIYPEDAYMNSTTFTVVPEIYGYGFDVSELARRIHRAEYGDTITITLGFLYPDITEEDLNVNYFQDVMAAFTSTSEPTPNANRDHNLQVACSVINGMILKPGETFDFNLILGPRTADAGYKSAPAYAGSSANIIGGGISQVASALRYCAILAGLQVDEYHTHYYAVPYSPMGTDAAITYGKENFVFTNSSSDPIQIFAAANGGMVTINIMGTKDESTITHVEYEIADTMEPETVYQYMTADNVYGYQDGHELQAGITGYMIKVYVCEYDAVTGMELSRTLAYSCAYNRRNQIVIRIDQGDDLMDPEAQAGL